MTPRSGDDIASSYFLFLLSSLRGTLFQGRRLIDTSQRAREADTEFFHVLSNRGSDEFLQKAKRSKEMFEQTRWEEYFFLVIASQAGTLLNNGPRQALTDKNIRKMHEEIWTRVGEVRDQREHVLEYGVQSKGKKQSKFIHEGSDGSVTYSVDGTSTMVTDKGHFLGGRVSVEEVMAAAENVLTAINQSGLLPDWLSERPMPEFPHARGPEVP